MRTDRLLASSIALAVASAAHSQVHVYVDDDAPDGGNGLSWDSAMNDLHLAIDLAGAMGADRGEIRVAGGVYIPGEGSPYTTPPVAFGDVPIQILGGFAGLADPAGPDTRDTSLYPSIFDGENKLHRLMYIEDEASAFAVSSVVLDGLRFQNGFGSMLASGGGQAGIEVVSCMVLGGNAFADSAFMLPNDIVRVTTCLFENNQSGAIGATDSDVSIRDSIFRSNSGLYGGAINARYSHINIDDSIFESNTSSGSGGAINIEFATSRIIDCDFKDNASSSGSGGAVYAFYTEDEPTIEAVRCNFEGNQADESGGAIYTRYGVSVDLCDFTSNSAGHSGGALYVNGLVDSSKFQHNSAGLNGGACHIEENSIVVSCDFDFNSSVRSGGAVYASDDDTQVNHCEFRNNNAGWDGGAVRGAESIQVSDFFDNHADDDGGAIAFAGYIRKCEIRGNSARDGGGGAGIVRIETSIIEDNEAPEGSALYYSSNNDYTVHDSIIRGGGDGTGALIWKINAAPLEISRSTLVRTGTSSLPMFYASRGFIWLESSIIWDYVESDVNTFEFAPESDVVLSHCVTQFGPDDLLLEPPAAMTMFGRNIQSDPLFVDLLSGDLSIGPASPAIDAGFQDANREMPGRDPYNRPRSPRDDAGIPNIGFGVTRYLDIGATEFQGTSCLADTNRDGVLSANDFTAWISAYNKREYIADQNRDGFIDQGDFTAWISNYAAGCN